MAKWTNRVTGRLNYKGLKKKQKYSQLLLNGDSFIFFSSVLKKTRKWRGLIHRPHKKTLISQKKSSMIYRYWFLSNNWNTTNIKVYQIIVMRTSRSDKIMYLCYDRLVSKCDTFRWRVFTNLQRNWWRVQMTWRDVNLTSFMKTNNVDDVIFEAMT